MWVKIKNKEVENSFLEVPYSAFKNSYEKKGYVLIEDKKIVKDIPQENAFINSDSKKEVVEEKKEKQQLEEISNEIDNIKNEQDEEISIENDIKNTIQNDIEYKKQEEKNISENIEKQIVSDFPIRKTIKKNR